MGGVEIDFNNLVQRTNVLILNQVTVVSQPGGNISLPQQVKFVLDMEHDNKGEMKGYILDMENNCLSKSIMAFHRVDEWLAFAFFLTRNGITVS